MRIHATPGMTIVSLYCLLVFSVISGCGGVSKEDCGAADVHIEMSSGQSFAQADLSEDASGLKNDPAPVLPDDARECPPELLTYAADVLGSPVDRVFPYKLGRSPERLYRVYAKTGMGGRVRISGLFMEREGHYLRLDSRAELVGINELLREYRFTRQDFQDPQATFDLFGDIATLHGVSRGMPACSFALTMMTDSETGLQLWLHGTETDEGVIKELCRDPEFVFQGHKWEVSFNLFLPDGRVDQWRLVGKHDPQANANEILRIDVTTIKPPGTLSYPLF
jgi:hypothetical protein